MFFFKRKKEKTWTEGIQFAESFLKSKSSISKDDVHSLYIEIGSTFKREFVDPRGLEIKIWTHNNTPFVDGVLAYVNFISHKIVK